MFVIVLEQLKSLYLHIIYGRDFLNLLLLLPMNFQHTIHIAFIVKLTEVGRKFWVLHVHHQSIMMSSHVGGESKLGYFISKTRPMASLLTVQVHKGSTALQK